MEDRHMEFLLNNNKKLDNVWKYIFFKLNFEKVYCLFYYLVIPLIGTLEQRALVQYTIPFSVLPFKQ